MKFQGGKFYHFKNQVLHVQVQKINASWETGGPNQEQPLTTLDNLEKPRTYNARAHSQSFASTVSIFLKYIPSQTTHPTSILPLKPSILTSTTTAPTWDLIVLTSIPSGEEGLAEHGTREDRQGQMIWGGPEKPQEAFGFFSE